MAPESTSHDSESLDWSCALVVLSESLSEEENDRWQVLLDDSLEPELPLPDASLLAWTRALAAESRKSDTVFHCSAMEATAGLSAVPSWPSRQGASAVVVEDEGLASASTDTSSEVAVCWQLAVSAPTTLVSKLKSAPTAASVQHAQLSLSKPQARPHTAVTPTPL